MKWWRIGLLMLVSLIVFVFTQWPDDKMHVVYCDVGEGDSAIIIKGKFQAVVDTGPDIGKFDDCFSSHVPFWDRRIEAVFVTHQHADHNGALGEIKKRYKIDKLIVDAAHGDVLSYGNIHIDTLMGFEPDPLSKVAGTNTANDSSEVLELRYGNFSALFTGDIDDKAELALLEKGVLNKINVLKVAHHGSKFGSSNIFLEMTLPKTAIISVGAKNNYGHPNSDTLIRLDTVGAKVYRTDKMGTVEVITDGETYTVSHLKK